MDEVYSVAYNNDDVASVYELYAEHRKRNQRTPFDYIISPQRERFIQDLMVVSSYAELTSADYQAQLREGTLYYCTDNSRIYLYDARALQLCSVTTASGREIFDEEEFDRLPRAEVVDDYF